MPHLEARATICSIHSRDVALPGTISKKRLTGGGLIFKAYDVNSAYQDCDIFVSVAKLKEHSTAGVTMAMKNLFGVPPTNIYGQNAGIDEPSKQPGGGRSMLHMGAIPERSA